MKNKKFFIGGVIAVIVIALGVSLFILKDDNKNLISLDKEALQEKIDNKDSFILVVSREGCPHCEEFLPVFKDILKEYDVTAYVVDIAKYSKDDRTYLNSVANISGTPTTVFIEKGEEKSTVTRIVGSSNRKAIISRLKSTGYIKE